MDGFDLSDWYLWENDFFTSLIPKLNTGQTIHQAQTNLKLDTDNLDVSVKMRVLSPFFCGSNAQWTHVIYS